MGKGATTSTSTWGLFMNSQSGSIKRVGNFCIIATDCDNTMIAVHVSRIIIITKEDHVFIKIDGTNAMINIKNESTGKTFNNIVEMLSEGDK